jgi:hypothetical protein
MQKYEAFPTVAWSAGPGCHGGCGQKLYVKVGFGRRNSNRCCVSKERINAL